MEILNLYPGSFGSNCYVLLSDGHAAIIDPSANASVILNTIARHNATPDLILLTHGHFDHMLALNELYQKSSLPIYLHASDADFPSDAHKNAFFYFFHQEQTYPSPTHLLQNGDLLKLGTDTIQVLHTPGHTPGSVCYLCNDQTLFTGDTLFDGGVGRCDLYGGSATDLKQSLSLLNTLSPSLVIYPGHGRSTTLNDALIKCK